MIKKYIDLSNLPKKMFRGQEVIDWINTKGYSCYFEYDDIKGNVNIIDTFKEGKRKVVKLILEYNDNGNTAIISYSDLWECRLGKLLNKITSDFKIEIGETFKEADRDIVIINREYRIDKNGIRRKWYEYHCNKCTHNDWTNENHLLRGCGCNCCCYPPRKVVKGINDIATTNPEMASYFVNEEDIYTHTYCSNDKVLLKCPDCGFVKLMKISLLYTQGFGCNKCSDGISYPNKFMTNLLSKLKVEFETEYCPEWISPKRYDFYIPSICLIIEMDGAFHSKDNTLSGKSKEESIQDDKYKDKKAIEHGLKVIRINCDYNHDNRFEFIKENVVKKLNNIFDLSNVDWIEISKKCEKNLLKEVCNYWNENYENVFIKDLEKHFKLSKPSVISYLKKGTKLGWLNIPYDGQEERLRQRNKKVEIFKNGISLGVFSSCKILADKSEELFGIKLNKSCISDVARGVRKTHKGFTFKYLIK